MARGDRKSRHAGSAGAVMHIGMTDAGRFHLDTDIRGPRLGQGNLPRLQRLAGSNDQDGLQGPWDGNDESG